MDDDPPQPTTHRQRRRILVAAGACAAAGGGLFLAQQRHATKAWPHGTPLAVDIGGLTAGRLLTVEWQGRQFLCPCHASRYDLAGRVFRSGPAPANLTVPAYRFAGDRLVIGEDA